MAYDGLPLLASSSKHSLAVDSDIGWKERSKKVSKEQEVKKTWVNRHEQEHNVLQIDALLAYHCWQVMLGRRRLVGANIGTYKMNAMFFRYMRCSPAIAGRLCSAVVV